MVGGGERGGTRLMQGKEALRLRGWHGEFAHHVFDVAEKPSEVANLGKPKG